MEGQPDIGHDNPNDPAFEAAQNIVNYIRRNPGTGSAEKMQNLLIAIRECGLAHLIGSLDPGNQGRVMRLLAAGPRAWFIAAHADDYSGRLRDSEAIRGSTYGTVEFAAELVDEDRANRAIFHNVLYWKKITE